MQATCLDELLPGSVTERLLAFKKDLSNALPGLVEEVILFDSRARGDAQADSDYDVAVLLRDGQANNKLIRNKISDIAYDYMIEGLDIQATPFNIDCFQPAATEIAYRIETEGVCIRVTVAVWSVAPA